MGRAIWRRWKWQRLRSRRPPLPGSSTRPVRALVIHLTKPSTSEAKVLGTLLMHSGPAVEFQVILNRSGDTDPASHLVGLATRAGITVKSVNVGLPVDPSLPPSRVRRTLARSMHPIRSVQILHRASVLDPEVVYTSQQRFDCRLGRLIAWYLGVPHVVHLHYTVGPWLRQPTIRRLRNADQVIAISEFIRRDAIAAGVPADRVVVIPNPIDLPAPKSTQGGTDRDVVTLGQTGRMAPEKGFAETVEVFERVHRAHHSTSLVLVGDGPERPAIEALVTRLGLDHVVRLAGWQTDIPSWLGQIDIFVNPSRTEPFGLAVLEAMAAGIPVVAYGDGGVAEIVVEGVTGFLIEPGDLATMVAAVSRLVVDPGLRMRLGASGRDRAAVAFDPVMAGATFTELLARVAHEFDDAHRRTDPTRLKNTARPDE